MKQHKQHKQQLERYDSSSGGGADHSNIQAMPPYLTQ